MKPEIQLVIGTSNCGKSAEFRRLLAADRWQLSDLSENAEVPNLPEDGASFAENACQKASQVANALGMWTLADDTGLEVDVLHGEPGIHTARFAGAAAMAGDNRRLLMARLEGISLPERSARFVCHLALADPNGDIQAQATGPCCGRILLREQGQGGFGYDRLFELVEYHRTLAEIGIAATACLSHRARAVAYLLPEMRRLLKSP